MAFAAMGLYAKNGWREPDVTSIRRHRTTKRTSRQVVMPTYAVIEYKSFFDSKRPDKPAANRVFCGDCLKPCRMLDDDLDNILSKSDFCQCRRRGHA